MLAINCLKDDTGKPITLYHGGRVWDSLKISSRDAFWLTPEVNVASGYADQYSQKDGHEIKAFHISMKNPLDITKSKVAEAVFGGDSPPGDYEIARDRSLIEKAILYAKDHGYDGLIHPDSDAFNRYTNGRVSYAVFCEDQVLFAPLVGLEEHSNTYDIPIRGLNALPLKESDKNDYREIFIDDDHGSAEGYVVSSDSENVANFLEREVGAELGEQILETLRAKTQRVAVFKSLNVDQRKRGKGIGTDLVGQFFDEAGDVDAVLLIADSHESQRKGFSLESFYEGFDFEKVAGTSAGPLMVYPIEIAEEMREFLKATEAPKRPVG